MILLVKIGLVIMLILFVLFIYAIMVAASWADNKEFEDFEQTKFIQEHMKNKENTNKG